MATLTYGGFWPFTQEVAKTGAYSVLLADTGTLFQTTGNAGSLTFTLPSLATGVGGWWGFYNDVSQPMIITAPAGKLLVDVTGAAGTTLTFSTASHMIGAFAVIWMNAAGTFYRAAVWTNGATLALS